MVLAVRHRRFLVEFVAIRKQWEGQSSKKDSLVQSSSEPGRYFHVHQSIREEILSGDNDNGNYIVCYLGFLLSVSNSLYISASCCLVRIPAKISSRTSASSFGTLRGNSGKFLKRHSAIHGIQPSQSPYPSEQPHLAGARVFDALPLP